MSINNKEIKDLECTLETCAIQKLICLILRCSQLRIIISVCFEIKNDSLEDWLADVDQLGNESSKWIEAKFLNGKISGVAIYDRNCEYRHKM